MTPSVKAIMSGKGLFGRLHGPKKRVGCETAIPPEVDQAKVVDEDHTVTIDSSFQTTAGASSPSNSERSMMGDVKKASELPYFFYEEEAHDPSPYVSIYSNH